MARQRNSRQQKQGIQILKQKGLQAIVAGPAVHLGKKSLFPEIGGTPIPAVLGVHVAALESPGRTVFVVRHGDRYLGAVGLMDTPREAARAVMDRLRALGMTRLVMLSGDNQRVAEAVAQSVGLTEAQGDLMPEHKVDAIKKLLEKGRVAMVGDGVNDAPAMANATVGIAMGAAVSDAVPYTHLTLPTVCSV